jgi:hypothetical protein
MARKKIQRKKPGIADKAVGFFQSLRANLDPETVKSAAETIGQMVGNANATMRQDERNRLAAAIYINLDPTKDSYANDAEIAKQSFIAADAFLAERDEQNAKAATPSIPNIPPMG